MKKDCPLNLRVTPALRRKIEASAERAGRSLTQEVELQLERSFQIDALRQAWSRGDWKADA